MKFKKLFIVSLVMLTILTLSAVSATEDISVDNLTVEDDAVDSIEEVDSDAGLNEDSDYSVFGSSEEDVISEKESISLTIVPWDNNWEYSFEEITPDSVSGDDYFKIRLSEKVNGTLSLYVDGKFIKDKKITGRTHYFNFETKDIGKHIAEVRYSGDDNYQPASATCNFEIVSCYISVYTSMMYGDDFLMVEVDHNNPIGDVVVVIDGKRYSAPLIRGSAFFDLETLSIGEHNVHIDYLGDSKHAARSIDSTLTVYPGISWVYGNVEFNEDNSVLIQLPSNAKGNLLVKVDGSEVGNVKLVNGYASVSLNEFKKIDHIYNIIAEYTGDDYDVTSIHEFFSVSPHIDVESEMIIGHQYPLTFTLPNSYSGTLTLNEGSENQITAQVVNGKASINFLAKKDMDEIIINYMDNSGYTYDGSKSIFVGPDPNMVATVESKVGQDPVFKVNVADDAGGAISVMINGKEYTGSYFTKSGSLTFPGLSDGTYTAVVTYSGDYKYPSVSKTLTFTKSSKKVSKKTKISLKLAKVKVKKSAKKLVLKATLKINGKAVKGKKITFKFNKKTYRAKTNKNGVAKVTIKKTILKKLKVGKKVKYQASYGKTTVKKTVKVKK